MIRTEYVYLMPPANQPTDRPANQLEIRQKDMGEKVIAFTYQLTIRSNCGLFHFCFVDRKIYRRTIVAFFQLAVAGAYTFTLIVHFSDVIRKVQGVPFQRSVLEPHGLVINVFSTRLFTMFRCTVLVINLEAFMCVW